MYDVYLIYRSVTHGQTGRAVLDREKIPCRLLRSPRELAPSGCAYALTIRRRDLERAYQFFRQENVKPADCFHRQTDGTYVRLLP